MPHAGEKALVAFIKSNEKKAKCEYDLKTPKWKANLAGSSDALGTALGNKPHADSEAELSQTKWPSQAHHLVPHLQLKAHPVSKWIKKGTLLFNDTQYNVDHKNNGKWMPYASQLKEWSTISKTKKRALMFKIMGLAKVQMHQGPHSRKNAYGIGEAPYKQRVAEYLDKIRGNAVSHYAGTPKCADCEGKEQDGKFPPRNNTVRFVDKASQLIEKDIDKCRIFVSRIAAEFADIGGFD